MTTTKETRAFQNAVIGQFDQINNPRIKRGDGSVVIKESFYYRMGRSAESWAEQVKARLEAAGIKANVRGEEHDATYPKTAYWHAIVTPAAE